MDELTIDGKTYISSKKAAAITGYAKDYIGQLCREGRVEARLVGRSWYVYEPSLTIHREEDGRRSDKGSQSSEDKEADEMPNLLGGDPDASLKEYEAGTTQNAAEYEASTSMNSSEKASIQAVWEEPTYIPEPLAELPPLEEKSIPVAAPIDPAHLSEMQNAWQEWFSTRPSATVPDEQTIPTSIEEPALPEAPVEPEETANDRYTVEEPAPVPVRRIVSDIAPHRVLVEPTARAYDASHTAPAGFQAAKANSQREVGQKASNLLAQASFVAVMILAVSLAAVATGFIRSLHLGGVTETTVFKALEGSTEIENERK